MPVPPKVGNVLADILSIPTEQVTPDLAAGQFEAWDSFSHLQIIMALESEFGIRFNPRRIPDLTTVSALVDELKASGAAME